MNRRDALRTIAAATALPALPRTATSADTELDAAMAFDTFQTVGDMPFMSDHVAK